MTTDLVNRAHDVAVAVGSQVIFGVRPHNGSVFCHCDGIESDGDTFAHALRGVVHGLSQRARSQPVDGDKLRERAERVLRLDGDA